jgi:thioredoxin reductase
MGRRMIVIGAGPMGLEAALLGHEAGFEVIVLEKGRVGDSLLRWGSTRFFSPFGMNLSARARRVLGSDAPSDGALLTGEEHARRVLLPLSARPPLAGRIEIGHRVLSIGRARMTRTDMPGHPLRAERPFRVVAENEREEVFFEAEAVLDASGVYDHPLRLGAGGLPARGERKLEQRIIRHLGALEEALPSFSGKRVLLAGHGHSAANAIALLDKAARTKRFEICWAVRSANTRPCVEIASDPLPERREVVARANGLAQEPPSHLRVERRAHVESLEETPDGILVRFTGERTGRFDAVVALTGYRPDLSIASELALEISPVSEGAAGIQRALANVTDCLTTPTLGAKDLSSGEPGFHLIGVKSYGRMPTFLLQNGLAQLESAMKALRAGD